MTGIRNLAGISSQTKTEALEKRMLSFAVQVIKKLDGFKEIPIQVKSQLIRSATSIGANYAEACNGSSKLDFRNKIYISKKEAAETRYWLDLVIQLTNIGDWVDLRQESKELVLILQSITNSLRLKSAK